MKAIKAACFGLKIAGSSIEFVDGGIEGADLQLALSYDNWRSAAESDAHEPFIDYFLRRKVEVVKKSARNGQTGTDPL